jgi:hypothetical protein
LFFSGQEEIYNGMPEQSFPSGLDSNSFKYQYKGVNLMDTTNALYLFTTDDIHWVHGTNRLNFFSAPVVKGVGMPVGHPRAITTYRDAVFFVTSDFRVASLVDGEIRFLSGPLMDDVKAKINATTEVFLEAFGDLEKDWVLVGLRDTANMATGSQQWVFDLRQGFWSPPWDAPITAFVSGKIRETDSTRKLAALTSTTSANARLTTMTEATVQDQLPGAATQNYAISARTNPLRNPLGNHVNMLRRGAMATVVHAALLTRAKFGGDTDPVVKYLLDEVNGTFTTVTGTDINDPVRHRIPANYVEKWFHINEAAARVSLDISKTASAEDFKAQTLDVVFEPEAGA